MNCQIYWGVDMPLDLPIWALTIEKQKWPFRWKGRCTWGVDLPLDLPIWVLAIEKQKWPFRWTGRCTWGVDLPLDLPMWALTIEIRNDHSDELADLWGVDLTLDLPIWALTREIRNDHSDELADVLGGRYATWSAYMSFNNRKQKWPFRWTGRCTWGVDLLLDLPIWALTIESRNHHSDELPDLGVDLPLHLPTWALTREIRNDHSDELADLGGRSSMWSAYMSFSNRN